MPNIFHSMSLFWIILLSGLAVMIPTGYAGWLGAPYAPTRLAVVRKAFDVLSIGEGDVVVDLGAGDGKIVLEAARRQATAIGYELSPLMWLIAWLRSLGQRKASIRFGNFYTKDLSSATVVFAFLMPQNMPRVRRFLQGQAIPNGKLFLSYTFPFKDMLPLAVIREPKCAPIYVYDLQELVAGNRPAQHGFPSTVSSGSNGSEVG
jgi:SAM-dependent methyltransferase